MSTATEERDIIYADRDHCVGVHGSTVVAFSLQPPNPMCLAAWTAALVQLAQRSDAPVSILIIVDSGARPPDDGTKREIQRVTSRHADSIGAFAYVIEGEGFGAAALRSAMSLMSLAARYPYPQKVFKSVGDAVAWMLLRATGKSGDGVAVASILAIVERMRQRLKPLAAAM